MDLDKDDLAVLTANIPRRKWISFTGCYINGASVRKIVFPYSGHCNPRPITGGGQCAARHRRSRKWLEQHLAEYRKQTATITNDFASMVDIRHGELKDIVLRHAETVKLDALFVSNRLVDANDVAKNIQKNLQAAVAEWNQSQDALNGNGSDLKKSAKNWTMPSIFAASTGILLARRQPVSSPC